jgi:hypothetical protein
MIFEHDHGRGALFGDDAIGGLLGLDPKALGELPDGPAS